MAVRTASRAPLSEEPPGPTDAECQRILHLQDLFAAVSAAFRPRIHSVSAFSLAVLLAPPLRSHVRPASQGSSALRLFGSMAPRAKAKPKVARRPAARGRKRKAEEVEPEPEELLPSDEASDEGAASSEELESKAARSVSETAVWRASYEEPRKSLLNQ